MNNEPNAEPAQIQIKDRANDFGLFLIDNELAIFILFISKALAGIQL